MNWLVVFALLVAAALEFSMAVLNQLEIRGSVPWEAARSGLILLSWIVGMTVLAEVSRQGEFSRRA